MTDHAEQFEAYRSGEVGREAVMSEIEHPNYYGGNTTYETIKVIHAWGLGFNLGNCVKYISRAGKKSRSKIEDLEKARFYLDYEIQLLKGEREV